MDARDDLIREMTHNHLYMTDERAAELVDAYAHELAEKQRQCAEEWARDGYVAEADGLRQAADLIDPEE